MKQYTPAEWFELATTLHNEIVKEYESINESEYNERYPKFMVMVNFFRMIRGEAFHSLRPHGMGDYQKKIYELENDLETKLEEMKEKIDPTNERFQFFLKQITRI